MRIIKLYKTTQFRLDTTGARMVGFTYNNFEDEVVNKHCIYYHELKPILFDSSDESDDEKMKNSEDDNESVASEHRNDIRVHNTKEKNIP
jgi:hypothetical protein